MGLTREDVTELFHEALETRHKTEESTAKLRRANASWFYRNQGWIRWLVGGLVITLVATTVWWSNLRTAQAVNTATTEQYRDDNDTKIQSIESDVSSLQQDVSSVQVDLSAVKRDVADLTTGLPAIGEYLLNGRARSTSRKPVSPRERLDSETKLRKYIKAKR